MKCVKAVNLSVRITVVTAALFAFGDNMAASATLALAAQQVEVSVADTVQVPKGNKRIGSYHATGVQVYQCVGSAWKGLEPAATLADKDGKPIILHSRGPIWVSTVDGSAVEAIPVDGARVDRPNAVPELLLKTRATRGDGLFAKVTYVQRLRTEGGVAPTGGCTPGTQVAVPYTATYAFFAPAY